MKESILSNKRILAVDDEPDVLMVLEEEILDACPHCHLDKATTFEEAAQLLASWTYDLVILDIMGVRGFELLEDAVTRNFPVGMLTAHALTPEALKRSIEMARRLDTRGTAPADPIPGCFLSHHLSGQRKKGDL